MDYKISSYRSIVVSTTAILNNEHCHGLYADHTQGLGEELNALDRRLALVTDLLETETEYLSLLQTVLDKYAEPFRKFTSMSVEDHRILFVGLEPVVSLSAMLTSKLDDAIETWDPSTTKIGNLFSRTYWSNYDDYANSYSTIKSTLEEKNKTDPTFSEFLQLRQGNSDNKLEDLLQLPVQRIPEYDKYLNELLQETDPSHPDYVDLSRAAAKVSKMVKDREDELANMDEQKRMDRVQDKFPHDDLQLDADQVRRQLASRRKSAPGAVLFKTLGRSKSTNSLLPTTTMGKRDMEIIRSTRHNANFNRQYLMEGNVEFSIGMQRQDRYLFLFSDLLLVAKQKSHSTFKLKNRIRVCELWIAFCIDDITELTQQADRSFVIGWPTTNVVATFKSVELKETWLNKLKEQIQEERAKVMPKALPLDVQHRDSNQTIQLNVETSTDAETIVKTSMEKLNIPDNDIKDYQLWVKLGHEDSPYPLCGHELPYAIKLSHLRDFAKKSEETLTEVDIQRIMAEMQNNNRKYEFFLKHKKSLKKPSIEEISSSKPSKGKRKSPLISLFRKHREEKKPQGKLFGHQLSNVTTPDELIAKQVKEMLTIMFREGPYTIGILRKSCNAKTLRELKQRLDDGEDCLSNEPWPPLVIGALVKDYLRSIPQSLLMEDLYEDWVQTNNELTENSGEKDSKLKETLGKLPPCHLELLRHLMCVLYHIDKKSNENKMTAYNLSVCIAPSLLWPKGNPNPLATPPGIIQYMIENCGDVFGGETLRLFGDVVEQKLRQDSSTDSDSMHSVLSTHSNFRRDDSSLDSLDREILYEGEMDSSPNISKSHHFSPSNLSGDSGLMLSDSQLYEEDGNGNDIISDRRNYSRSASHYMQRDTQPTDPNTSRSLDSQFFNNYQFDPQNPVPPPRRARRKGSDPNISPNLEYSRKPMKFMSQVNFSVSGRYDKRHSAHIDMYKSKRHSTESLKSVEESSEADSEINVKSYNKPRDIGTLIKSASGAHLFFEEINNPPGLFNFDDTNRASGKRRDYYKANNGAMPMSPQSKYSLSSSRDSVLSDSSGSYLNRNNSPEPVSSAAETPDNDDHGMSQWLSKQANYTSAKNLQFSLDDSELEMNTDKKSKVNYLVSPKSSPRIRRRSPIPLEARRSFPIQTDISPKGSGSNSSKEAEDIIKSPKLRVTYCSQDSLDKRNSESSNASKLTSPHLDLYNNNSQMAMKQLNIYSSGLQGTSPPPRVVLQGFNSQPQRRDNTPVKGNHNIFPQARRRSSIDMGEIGDRKPYLMQETSVSTEGEDSSESEEEEETVRHMTMITMSPLTYNIPQKIISDEKKSSSSESLSKRNSSLESLSKSSSNSEDSLNTSRPDNPPGYDEAVQRNYLLKQGLSPDEVHDMDSETLRQREASMRAKQLYEQSIKQFQEQKGYSLPSQKFEKTLGSLGEKQEDHNNEEDIEESSSEDEQPEYNPRKLYEESVRLFMEEQEKTKPKASLVKRASQEDNNFSISNSKDQLSNMPVASGLHRSHSDVGDRSLRQTSREATPTKRPNRPPPYNNPPPYHNEHADPSPVSARRHLFPKAGGNMYANGQTQSTVTQASKTDRSEQKPSQVTCSLDSNINAQNLQMQKRRDILVSSRTRTVASASTEIRRSDSPSSFPQDGGSVHTDNSVRSAQSEIGQYRKLVSADRENIISRNPAHKVDSPVLSGSQNKQSNLSASVFRPRASSLDPKEPHANPTASQGHVSYRNPNFSKPVQPVSKSQTHEVSDRSSNRHSLDASVLRNSLGIRMGTKELPWSVKRLSNMFDLNKPESSDSDRQQSQSSSTSRSSSSTSSVVSSSPHTNNLTTYTPPPALQRTSDIMRSSTSSNSSVGSSSNGQSVTKKSPFTKLGPQARDSFSSTDESDCSCRYSLNCRRDNNSLEELDNISFSDITYV